MELLILPKIKIQNANALSSPYSIGFPGITGFMGAAHMLERLIQNAFSNIKLKSVGIAVYDFNLKTFNGHGDFEDKIITAANPLNKDGERPSFIPEAKCDLTVTMIIEIENLEYDDEEDFIQLVEENLLPRMRMAGGDILESEKPETLKVMDEKDARKLKRRLMPGFVIINRGDLVRKGVSEGMDAMDAIIDYLAIHYHCSSEEAKIQWKAERKTNGWIIPISNGFYGVSEFIKCKEQRNYEHKHRFAEPVLTLGEFIMPFRLESIDEMLWEYRYIQNEELYLCVNKNN